MKTDRYHGG